MLRAGGNTGLGLETACALAQAGARVIITSRNLSAGQDAVTRLRAAGLKVSCAQIKLCCVEQQRLSYEHLSQAVMSQVHVINEALLLAKQQTLGIC